MNATISDARLTLLAMGGRDARRFQIACVDRDDDVVSFELHGSPLRLEIHHMVEIDDEMDLHTVSYTYRLAQGEKKTDWLVRWEYFRQKPKDDYPYPLAHVHVNAEEFPPGTSRRAGSASSS